MRGILAVFCVLCCVKAQNWISQGRWANLPQSQTLNPGRYSRFFFKARLPTGPRWRDTHLNFFSARAAVIGADIFVTTQMLA